MWLILQVFHDMVGMFDQFTPKFSKRYVDLGTMVQSAVKDYVAEVEKQVSLVVLPWFERAVDFLVRFYLALHIDTLETSRGTVSLECF